MAHVLIVEDEPAIRHVLCVSLRAEGHEVSEAQDGREALNRVVESLPDLILLDLRLPEIDGYEFLRELPYCTATPPPVLVVSAYLPVGRTVEGREAIEKPFVIADILERVKGLTSSPLHSPDCVEGQPAI
jgi:DNA-binding response OmpR family regulator